MVEISKRTTALGVGVASVALALGTTTSASAASFNSELIRHPKGDSGVIRLSDGPYQMGTVTWNADPTRYNHVYGDSVYVNDQRSDGYSILGQAKVRSTGEVLWRASTAGDTAPATARSTDNVSEGTPILFRGCVMKKGVSYYCSPWHSGKA